MKELFNKTIFISIFTIILFFSITLIVKDKVSFSENENRYLERFPSFDIEKLFDGDYVENMQDYVSDHFPMRSDMLFFTSKLELLIGKNKISNVYISKDNYLISEYNSLNDIDKYINRINDFYQKNNKKNINLILIPSSVTINDKLLPRNAITNSELDDIHTIYDNTNVKSIDIYNTLYQNNKTMPMFYKTDHHWTSYGAYYSYIEFCKNNGLDFKPLSNYNISKITDSFNGTLYSKTNLYDSVSDDIYIFDLKNNNYEVHYDDTDNTTDSIFNYSYLDRKDKYSVFLDNNHSLVTITNHNQNNGKELLLIKDSFGNSFSQFLIEDYYKVHIIDLRFYLLGVNDYIESNPNIDDILLLYNINTLGEDTGILNLK